MQYHEDIRKDWLWLIRMAIIGGLSLLSQVDCFWAPFDLATVITGNDI